MQMSILANQLENIFRGSNDYIRYTKMVVDISQFPNNIWNELAYDIMYHHYTCGGSVKWSVTPLGHILAKFKFSPMDDSALGDVIFVHVDLKKDINSKNIMTLQMRSFNPPLEYDKIIGVTDDNLWLDDPRRFYDDYKFEEFDFTLLMQPPPAFMTTRSIIFDEVYYTERMQREMYKK
jgi:hypothetical protein